MNSACISKAVRSSLLGLTIAVGAAGIPMMTPHLAHAAVDVQGLPQEAVDPANNIGKGVAAKADRQLKAEVGNYARQNMFGGITGDLIPSGEVTFARAGLCVVDGHKGAVLEFDVHARAKVDVGTRKFGISAVRKVWAVDTQQKIQVVLLPKVRDDGGVTVDARADIVSATATPERQAKQSDADGFRDQVSGALREKLSAYTGNYDAKGLIDRAK